MFFYFHACTTGFACHFLTLRQERDLCAYEHYDFSFSTSTVKLTSKSLRTVRKVHHFPPLAEAGAPVHARIQGVLGTACHSPTVKIFGKIDSCFFLIESDVIYFRVSVLVIWRLILKI